MGWHGRAWAASVALASTLAGCADRPGRATADDTAAVRKTCSKHADYQPAKGPKVLAAVDARLSESPPWRGSIQEVCYFDRQSEFRVYTLIARDDLVSQRKVCDALRASGETGHITPIFVHCRDGKWCTTCAQGGGGHR